MYAENIKQCGDSLNLGLPVVAENDACPCWEAVGDVSLTSMHECWYCRFSDFRNEIFWRRTHSVCRLPGKPNWQAGGVLMFSADD